MNTVALYNGVNEVSGITGVGDFNTESVDVFGQLWSFTITGSGLDGTPTYTIECSNDDSIWYTYDDLFKTVGVANSVTEQKVRFEYRYFRIVWTSTGVTTGTITFFLNTDG